MKQVFLSGDGQVELNDVPLPGRMHGAVLVQNAYSLISTGTEGAALTKHGGVLGIYEKVKKSSDRLGQVWEMAQRQGIAATAQLVRQKLTDHIPLGYSCAGRVVETDEGLPYRQGDLVACMGAGFANHAEYVVAPKNLVAKIPAGVDLDQASFAALACIALQGIRRLELTPGENIGVVGLGLIGQLCLRLLHALGYQAYGIDLSAARVNKAKEVPGVQAWTPEDASSIDRVMEMTSGHGLDGVIVCAATKSSLPVNEAFDMCRKGGRVSMVGAVGLDLSRDKMYAKELELRLSCSYGPGRYDPLYELDGVDYPINHARWTEGRNLQLFLRLLAEKRLDVSSLISRKSAIEDASDVYKVVQAADASTYGLLFDYKLPKDEKAVERPATTIVRRARTAQTGDKVRIGLIGVGSYAKAMHVPNLQALKDHYEITGVASRSGGTAAIVAKKVDAALVTSDYRALLDDKDIDAVLISTRHASHARMILDSLAAGKHVFVEKPMTTTVEDGERVVAKVAETGLVLRVGFNRRFSPHLNVLRQTMGDTGRRMLLMRVNAGNISGHWSTDPEEGGRIVGEGVHFIDLANWMFGGEPIHVSALPAGEPGADNANLLITLGYANGGAAELLYTSLGSPRMGKEYFEVFGGGRSGYCRDYAELKTFPAKVRSAEKLIKGDKGQREALREFAMAIKGQKHSIAGADEMVGLAATRVALRALGIE